MTQPLISVLLPCYNSESFIGEAIRSVLDQTFCDFELIVIDDASSDNTIAIVEAFTDPRIRLIRKQKNTGYTDSLNAAIDFSKGVYIARMDADDICHRERFQTQIDFLEQNKDVVLCGSWYRTIPGATVCRGPIDPEVVKVWLLYGNAVCHPSVMFRKEFFIQNHLRYDRNYEPSEDYELWTRVVEKGKISIVPEILIDYRIHEKQVSAEKTYLQGKRGAKGRIRMFKYLKPSLTLDEETLLNKVMAVEKMASIQELNSAVKILSELQTLNLASGFYLQKDFEIFVKTFKQNTVTKYFVLNDNFNMALLRDYFKGWRAAQSLSVKQNFAVIAKSILRWKGEKSAL